MSARNELNKQIGALIRHERTRRGLGLNEFAARAEVCMENSNLSAIENGKRSIGWYWLIRIAAAFGCRVVVSFEPLQLKEDA